MHWVDVHAEKLLGRGPEHVIESGTSISGQPHLGSAMDIILADGILRAVTEMGGGGRAIWAMDDMDGLRKVPEQLPAEFNEYIGRPAYKLPCPDGCCDSFTEHFTRPFLESLASIGVEPEPVSVAGMYAAGKYDRVVRTALERASEIRAILKEISGSERDDDWLPFFPICEECGRILTTRAYDFDGQHVKYRCTGGVAGKNRIEGCGHEGEAGIRQGKLPWRVEWAARWSHLGVTCEPMGKDLMAAGGTYETSRVICERIFGGTAPEPVAYEWIVVEGGKRLGKSAGRVLTLKDMVDIATPEITRYFFFRTRPTSHKVIDFRSGIPKLAEEYETAERLYFGLDTGLPEKEHDDIRRTYEMARVADVPEEPFQVPYSHLISVVQTARDWDHILEKLDRTGDIAGMTPDREARLKRKAEAVRNWLDRYAPEDARFTLQDTPPPVELAPGERAVLGELLRTLRGTEWQAGEIHNAIHNTAKAAGMRAGAMFRLLYRIFLDRDRGPRLGYLLASLDRDWVLDRIEHFAGRESGQEETQKL